MIKASVATASGGVVEFDLPETLSEIKYRSKLDFDTWSMKILEYCSETTGEDFNSSYYLHMMCMALSEFFTSQNTPADCPEKEKAALAVDLTTIYSLDGDKLLDMNGNLLPEIMQRHIDMYNKSESVDYNQAEWSLMYMYEHIYKLIASYKFDSTEKDYSFVYKGEKFKVFAKYRDTLLGIDRYDKVSVGELAEAFEVTRQAQKLWGKADAASVQLTEVLRLLAILARKKGEVFPMDKSEEWIESRSKYFLDIDFQSASGVFFYLTLSLSGSERDQIASTFLSHLSNRLTLLMNTSESNSTKTKPSGTEQDSNPS